MKKLYAILFLTAALGVIERSNAASLSRAGSRLLQNLRTTAPHYFSTGQQAVKPQAFGSRFGSLQPKSRPFSTGQKTAHSIPKVGPRQRSSLIAGTTIAGGAFGAAQYLTEKAPNKSIFGSVLAEEEKPFNDSREYLPKEQPSSHHLPSGPFSLDSYIKDLHESLDKLSDLVSDNGFIPIEDRYLPYHLYALLSGEMTLHWKIEELERKIHEYKIHYFPDMSESELKRVARIEARLFGLRGFYMKGIPKQRLLFHNEFQMRNSSQR